LVVTDTEEGPAQGHRIERFVRTRVQLLVARADGFARSKSKRLIPRERRCRGSRLGLGRWRACRLVGSGSFGGVVFQRRQKLSQAKSHLDQLGRVRTAQRVRFRGTNGTAWRRQHMNLLLWIGQDEEFTWRASERTSRDRRCRKG